METIDSKNNMNERELIDYNTDREPLILPEYGRTVQNMVDYCRTISDREERQQCANTIVNVMLHVHNHNGEEGEVKKKVWNHLAAMANYDLDIDYPYDIERLSDRDSQRTTIPYPQHPIGKRHYGAILENLAKKIETIDDDDTRLALTKMVANQMKRSLGKWNKDSMTEEKVLDDLASMTDGKSSYLPGELHLLSDNEILNDIQQNKSTKKKKKKG